MEWQELARITECNVTLVLSTTTIRGRSVYSIKIGREREDGSIASHFPLEFLQDDGVTRTGIRLSHLHSLLLKAADTAQTHASGADAERATRLAERDTRTRASEPRRGLRQLAKRDALLAGHSAPIERRSGNNKDAKRERNRREREQMRGKP